jgi:hypothetical protein
MSSRASLSLALLAAALCVPVAGGTQTADSTRVARTDSATADAPSSRCMELHLREAAHLNRQRMPIYSALTGGRSRGISRRLIWTERLAIPVAWYVDWRARRFLRAGIRVTCDDFVPMAHTPALRERIADPPPLSAFAPSDPRRVRRTIDEAYRSGGFAAASTAIEREIDQLQATPAFHCMTRHLLESALRIRNQAPVYEAQARERGLRSPAGVSRLMLNLHLSTLGEAAKLDRRAAPLQAEGIPIICQDVPPIPPAADSPNPHP